MYVIYNKWFYQEPQPMVCVWYVSSERRESSIQSRVRVGFWNLVERQQLRKIKHESLTTVFLKGKHSMRHCTLHWSILSPAALLNLGYVLCSTDLNSVVDSLLKPCHSSVICFTIRQAESFLRRTYGCYPSEIADRSINLGYSNVGVSIACMILR